MFTAIMIFEVKRRLRSISTYVYFALFAILAFLLMCTAGGAFKRASVILDSGGKTFVNSPFSLNVVIALLSYFGLITTAALMGQAVYQDFEHDTHALFFTTPIRKAAYLGGRFAAAFLVLTAIFSSIALGMALAT